MNCQRAAEVLNGLVKNALVATATEIELLLSLGIIVEADPDDFAAANWLELTLREHARVSLATPRAVEALAERLAITEEQLKSDWYRIKASKPEIAQRESERITMRRALAILRDSHAMGPIFKIANEARQLAPDARYVACPALGSELYALTHKGFRIRAQLEMKMNRVATTPFKGFVFGFDKVDQKMRRFGEEIATLSAHVGYVRKHREQIVIGLAKAGAVDRTIATYRTALAHAPSADVAVTHVRHAATFGGPGQAASRLKEAELALRRVGYPPTPVVAGAAKSLLGFALEPGVLRFVEIHRRLENVFQRTPLDLLVKFTSRLMSAAGTPRDIIGRVIAAASSLALQSPNQQHAARRDVRASAVALAAMVRTQDAVPAAALRFREIESELVRSGISSLHDAEANALECVACAGTPAEVVATVNGLLSHLVVGRQPVRGDVAIACAFAKRFAF